MLLQIIIVFCVSININYVCAFEYYSMSKPKEFYDVSNRDLVCTEDKCLMKCCPKNKIVAIKYNIKMKNPLRICEYDNGTHDVSVFNKAVVNFTVKAGIFDNNQSEFRRKFRILTTLPGVNISMNERGEAVLEVYNSVNRFTYLPNYKFCYDFVKIKNIIKPNIFIHAEKNCNTNVMWMTAAMLVSSFFLLLVLIVYSLLKELRNLGGMILMAYVASLMGGFLMLAVTRITKWEVKVCIGLTFFTYFFLLASFCWMSVMSYDIWWTFRGYAKARPIHRRGECFKFCMYSLYAWGLPLAMSIAVIVLNETDMKHIPWFITPRIPQMGCFIEGEQKFLYLYVPMLILIVCNWMFYLMTAFNIWRLSRGTGMLDTAAAGTPQAHRTHRQRFLVYLKLSVVMGLNWVLEVVSYKFPGYRVWHISDLYNILIGLAIFLIFVCKGKILKRLIKRLRACRHPRSASGKVVSRSHSSDSGSSQETQTLQICSNPKGPSICMNNF